MSVAKWGVVPNYAGLPAFLEASIVFFSTYLQQAEQLSLMPKVGLYYIEPLPTENSFQALFSRFTDIALPTDPEEAVGKLLVYMQENGTPIIVVGSSDLLTLKLKKGSWQLTSYFEFMREFARQSKGKYKIIFAGRVLPRHIVVPFIETQDGFVLGDEFTTGDPLYAPETLHLPHLEVRMFGTGEILIDGIPVTDLGGPLPRNLFYFFLCHPIVTRDEIFAQFWPTLEVKPATNVFHVTKRKGDEACALAAELADFNLTDYDDRFYRLSPSFHLHFDLFELWRCLSEAENEQDADTRLSLLKEAVELTVYPFLYGDTDDDGMAWIVALRKETTDQTVEALVEIGRTYINQNNHEAAFPFLTRAIRTNPIREDIVRDLMNLYASLNQPEGVVALYDTLKEILQKKFEVSPDRQTRELLVKLVPTAKP